VGVRARGVGDAFVDIMDYEGNLGRFGLNRKEFLMSLSGENHSEIE
jgi:hypothetical protein